MRFIVMGNARHGKGTFCTLALAEFGLTAISSSLFACEKFLFEALKDTFGYTSEEQCFADRHNHRELWYNQIAAYNTPDGTRLGRELFENHQIYDGIRSIDEFQALKQAGLFDLAIWIDASERLPEEDKSSISVTRRCADVVIENNEDELSYHDKVRALLRALTGQVRTHDGR